MGSRATMGRGSPYGRNDHRGYCEGRGPWLHEDTMRLLGHYKGQRSPPGDRGLWASYRVTRKSCSTRLPLWETQIGEGNPSV